VFMDTAKAPGGRPWAAVLDARPGAVQRPGFPPVLPLTPEDPLAMTARLDALLCPKPGAQARILAVFSRQPGISQELINQTLWVARYGRLDIVLLDVFELDRLPYRWLDQYAAVVLAAPSLPIGLAERFAWVLDGYVRRGGAVAALAGMEDQAFWPVFGIGRMDWAEQPFTGIVCDDTFVPGASPDEPVFVAEQGETLPTLVPEEGATVFCRGARGGTNTPVAFARTHGAGRTFYWHGGHLAHKAARGLLLLSILEAALPAAAGFLNAHVFFVDDCPRPIWDEPVGAGKDITDRELYADRWWPEVASVLARHKVKPTFALVLTYDNVTKPPLRPALADGWGESAYDFARRVLTGGHEVALHGYNHVSLAIGPDGWPTREAMEAALREARSAFPAVMAKVQARQTLPLVYVAPHNVIDPTGKKAVCTIFPELSAIATVYVGEGEAQGQEFWADMDCPGVIDLPRVSAGYFLADDALEVTSALVSPGVFAHFIHPDDVLDQTRGKGKTIADEAAGLDRLLGRVDAAYPFLRRMYASELAGEVKRLEAARLEVTRQDRSIRLRARGASGMAAIARIPRGLEARVSGCETLFASSREGRVHVLLGQSDCIIGW